MWTTDRPDFVNAAKNTLQQSDVSRCSRSSLIHCLCFQRCFHDSVSLFHPQVEYKYDKEMMKGCVIPVVDDKLIVLCKQNAEMASNVSLLHLYWSRELGFRFQTRLQIVPFPLLSFR